jgi:hypothetical protein
MESEMTLRDWMQSLYDQYGRLTPEIVLDAARAPESPAHGFVFGMSAAEAAERFYLDRAHRLIQTVRVEVTRVEGKPKFVRAWHAVPGDDESRFTYLPLEELVQRPDKLELARNEAIRRVRDAQRSVEDLDALIMEPRSKRKASRAVKQIKAAQELLAS